MIMTYHDPGHLQDCIAASHTSLIKNHKNSWLKKLQLMMALLMAGEGEKW